MIKRTMQEWADFTGCYVTKNENGEMSIHDQKPVMHPLKNRGWWSCASKSYTLSFFSNNELQNITITTKDADTHDWRVLVEPKGMENERKN